MEKEALFFPFGVGRSQCDSIGGWIDLVMPPLLPDLNFNPLTLEDDSSLLSLLVIVISLSLSHSVLGRVLIHTNFPSIWIRFTFKTISRNNLWKNWNEKQHKTKAVLLTRMNSGPKENEEQELLWSTWCWLIRMELELPAFQESAKTNNTRSVSFLFYILFLFERGCN